VRNKYKRAIKDKWERTGFLEQLPEKHKIYLAIEFEKMAQYLSKFENNYGERISTIILPCIRRVFHSSDYNKINSFHILNVLNDLYECFEGVIEEEIKRYSRIDIEAEICCYFCEYYVAKFLITKRQVLIEKTNYHYYPFRSFCKKNGWNFLH